MKKQLVLGAEAIAMAALDEGISGVFAYPGTPSTEIAEYIQRDDYAQKNKIHARWSVNEKTAYESALGMSYAGKRSMVCMKHVGLNVAADAFMNSSITGIHGGLVLVVADDPSMHSSQNEQDSRVYGKFAFLPLLEPSNQQEAYNCMRDAFKLSETVKLPVIVRITTRLAHSRAIVERRDMVPQNELNPETDKRKWILLPANARNRYASLLELQKELVTYSETSPYNRLMKGSGTKGVIAFGLAYNYVMETIREYDLDIAVLKISQYPLPERLIKEFIDTYDSILVAEEGYPIYEELLRGYLDNPKIAGRLDNTLPRKGELTPDAIAQALGVAKGAEQAVTFDIPGRPPRLCDGCGHRDMYEALNKTLLEYRHQHVFSDIGCYTLGALPPFNAINTCVNMGASITMAVGAAQAGLRPAVAVIGDSTFTHSGITGLLDAVNFDLPVTVIISDNDTTAMTGGQDSSGSGSLYELCVGVGVSEEHIKTIVPLKRNLEENMGVLKKELDYDGVSVILASRACVQTLKRNRRRAGNA